ncbi:histidine kinase dimerization/phospho-acceptor domain-containing protein [uncultured Cohaesibacter sp.]|uniref:histidine kinase dimerization/phospho-acceptor domain-containing protein n=1 Tax=uncultured Cohaesibacter sp. TaxID=1002546 RepID=UPI0029C94D0F|nr:histidine kinase dimerization/phospho-acceptor domain-containing protein [uncultured Cohaesibacter sp.]
MKDSEGNHSQASEIAGSPFHYDLTRRITHDLKAPIRQIIQLTDMLIEDNEGGLDEESVQTLNMMRERADKMGHLVEALRSLSNSFCRPLEMQNVVINDILADALNDSNLQPESLDLGEPMEIWTDREVSSRVFNNIFQNFLPPSEEWDRARFLLKLHKNPENDPALEIQIPDYPHEIKEKIGLVDYAAHGRQDLMQILLLAESAEAANRLGWKVFLHTGNKKDLLLNVYF